MALAGPAQLLMDHLLCGPFTAEWGNLFLVIFWSLTLYYMAYFYLFLYILAVSPMGCLWKMPYPVSPYACRRVRVPISVLFRS
uniref:Uncharacterized protein n=1 Tax=Aegilops tauschii subsp. strangulata TaxID=200361 RepID=A0A453I3R6_AEGTS